MLYYILLLYKYLHNIMQVGGQQEARLEPTCIRYYTDSLSV
jgi:hypothetical protein